MCGRAEVWGLGVVELKYGCVQQFQALRLSVEINVIGLCAIVCRYLDPVFRGHPLDCCQG
jgi:hypothetical protein